MEVFEAESCAELCLLKSSLIGQFLNRVVTWEIKWGWGIISDDLEDSVVLLLIIEILTKRIHGIFFLLL